MPCEKDCRYRCKSQRGDSQRDGMATSHRGAGVVPVQGRDRVVRLTPLSHLQVLTRSARIVPPGIVPEDGGDRT